MNAMKKQVTKIVLNEEVKSDDGMTSYRTGRKRGSVVDRSIKASARVGEVVVSDTMSPHSEVEALANSGSSVVSS